MAKFGVDVTNMSSVKNVFNPQEGVVDKSGAMRTAATTGLIGAAGQLGVDAYKGYQMAELETGVEKEIDAYMAPRAAEQVALEAGALAKSVDQMWNRFDTTVEDVNPVERQIQGKLKEFKAAKDQGVMTPEEFSARVLTVTREAINKNPGLMPELKAHAERVLELSGISSYVKQDQVAAKSAQEKLKDRETYLEKVSISNNIYYDPTLPMYVREKLVEEAEKGNRAHSMWKRQGELIKEQNEQDAIQYVADNQVDFTVGAGSELANTLKGAIANSGGKQLPPSQIQGILDNFYGSYVANIKPNMRNNPVMKEQIAHVKDITDRLAKNLSSVASGDEQKQLIENELAVVNATSKLNLARNVDPATAGFIKDFLAADPRGYADSRFIEWRARTFISVMGDNTQSKDAQEAVPTNIQDKRYAQLTSNAVDASRKAGDYKGFSQFMDGSNKLAASIQSPERRHLYLNNNIEALAKSDMTGIDANSYSKVNSMVGSYLNDPNYGIPMMFKEADRLKTTIDVLPNGNMLFVGNEADKFNATFANKFNNALHAYANAQGLSTKEAAGNFYKEYFAPHVGAGDMMSDIDIGKSVKSKFEQPKPLPAKRKNEVSGDIQSLRMDITPEVQAKMSALKQVERGDNLQADIAELAQAIKQAKDGTVRGILKREYRDLAGKEFQTTDYGKRHNSEDYKGTGWLGELKVPGTDSVATEYSIDVNIDGKDVQIPTLVPTLTKEEQTQLLQDISKNRQPSENIVRKAVEHAKKRLADGKSPFKG